MRSGRLLCVLAAVASLLVTWPSQAAPSSCPAARTCPSFALVAERWPAAAGRPVVVPYLVSTRITSGFVSVEQLAPMVRAATKVWERANPRVRFRFMGTTDVLPGLRDGKNVIGFSLPQGVVHVEGADSVIWSDGKAILEADINIDPTHEWVWHPCPQRNGGCTGHSRSTVPAAEVWGPEIQGVVEHELGHWLSLGHSDADRGAEQTMSSVTRSDNLAQQTLALGDVLGARAAYPCGRCGGQPVVYTP